ncbi:hypothetical protein RIF29_34222 [Crotalaria pallida]|uniref:Inhibitor I9 domain-containing protein n=1 Tax=Crotalaria pallida TaxID=3830 RepID=A0AAN9EEH6_CROPI
MEVFYFIALIYMLSFHIKFAEASELSPATETSNSKVYIIHVRKPEAKMFTQSEELESWYHSFMPSTTMSSDEQPRMIHSYKHVWSGFAARLTQEELRAVEKKNGFISAHPERILRRQTTHSPRFLGLQQPQGLWKESNLQVYKMFA